MASLSVWRALPVLTAALVLAARPCEGGAAAWMHRIWHTLAVPSTHLPPAVLQAGPVCLDGAGRPVDWWLALKLPGGGTWAHLDSRAEAEALATQPGEGRFRCAKGLQPAAAVSSLPAIRVRAPGGDTRAHLASRARIGALARGDGRVS